MRTPTTHPGSTATGVRAVFQPVVDLRTGAVAGFEALARGAVGTPLESPVALFAAARADGRLAELELACHSAAVASAEGAGWSGPLGLFLNIEPELIEQATMRAQLEVLERARRRGPVVVELTERALTGHPAELLRGVRELRDLGCVIALDDVGADDRSLALMPFLRPDVVKLDLRLIQGRPSGEIARVVHAVSAEAARSGATVVAEGIETEAHLETALAFGATLGQGYRFGRPGAMALQETVIGLRLSPRTGEQSLGSTPFALVAAAGVPIRRGSKRLLTQITAHLEHEAATLGRQAVLLGGYQHRGEFGPKARERYARVGRDCAFVAVLAEGIEAEPAPGVRGQDLRPDEPLRAMHDVAVVAPHFAAVLVSHDLGDTGVPDEERRFDFAVVYDRALAVDAAGLLLARIQPAPGP